MYGRYAWQEGERTGTARRRMTKHRPGKGLTDGYFRVQKHAAPLKHGQREVFDCLLTNRRALAGPVYGCSCRVSSAHGWFDCSASASLRRAGLRCQRKSCRFARVRNDAVGPDVLGDQWREDTSAVNPSRRDGCVRRTAARTPARIAEAFVEAVGSAWLAAWAIAVRSCRWRACTLHGVPADGSTARANCCHAVPRPSCPAAFLRYVGMQGRSSAAGEPAIYTEHMGRVTPDQLLDAARDMHPPPCNGTMSSTTRHVARLWAIQRSRVREPSHAAEHGSADLLSGFGCPPHAAR